MAGTSNKKQIFRKMNIFDFYIFVCANTKSDISYPTLKYNN